MDTEARALVLEQIESGQLDLTNTTEDELRSLIVLCSPHGSHGEICQVSDLFTADEIGEIMANHCVTEWDGIVFELFHDALLEHDAS